jgi:hypothetical protein
MMNSIDFSNPKNVLEAYVHADIRKDLDGMYLTTTGKSYTESTRDVFGDIFSRAVQQEATRRSKNESVQRWEVSNVIISDDIAVAELVIQIENGPKISKKVMELSGFVEDPVTGRAILDPNKKAIIGEEAYKIAREDPTIKPLIYQLNIKLRKENGKWLVKTDTPEYKALVSIIDDGRGMEFTEPYLTNP